MRCISYSYSILNPSGIRITQIFWEEERNEFLVTEAKSYMEIAPLTELEVIANTMHSRVGCE